MKYLALAGLACLLTFACASAQSLDEATDLPDSAVVAERGGQVVTMGDMRAKLRTALSASKRKGFFADGSRVGSLIEDMLASRQIAAQARAEGLDKDPDIQAEIEAYTISLLARRQIAKHMRSVQEPDYEILARERYLANKADYATPESRDVRHILVRPVNRDNSQAIDIINQVHELLVSGKDFDEVFAEYSEEGNAENKGWVHDVKRGGDYDPDFTLAAFLLDKPGDISPPVQTPFGFHVIRLEHITPSRERAYDEVKDEIVAKVRGEFREGARAAYIQEFSSLPVQFNDETMKKLPNAQP